MTFALSFMFAVCGLVFFAVGNLVTSRIKLQTKNIGILQTAILQEHIELLKTYRDVIKYAKSVKDPFDVTHHGEQPKPTIQ